MNLGVVLLLTIIYGAMMLLIQRAEARRRLVVALVFLPIGAVIQWYISQIGNGSSGVIAIIVALILNFLFWAVIGRYNPVGSSDDIHVIGLDD